MIYSFELNSPVDFSSIHCITKILATAKNEKINPEADNFLIISTVLTCTVYYIFVCVCMHIYGFYIISVPYDTYTYVTYIHRKHIHIRKQCCKEFSNFSTITTWAISIY